MNKLEPLGLPAGSVRAIISLLIVGSTCIQFVIGTVPDPALLTLAGVVSTFYFVKRQNDPVVVTLPEPVIGEVEI